MKYEHFSQGASYKTHLTWAFIEESNDEKVEKCEQACLSEWLVEEGEVEVGLNDSSHVTKFLSVNSSSWPLM